MGVSHTVTMPSQALAAAGRRRSGFTLVELLVVVAMIALLMAMLMPSLSGGCGQARVAVCSGNVRSLLAGLAAYAHANRQVLPPFAYSDVTGNLPLSGHWGGSEQTFAQKPSSVNLHSLLEERLAAPGHLLCPAAGEEIVTNQAGYFSAGSRFSTYTRRMPFSADLFRGSEPLCDWTGRGLLHIYAGRVSGQKQYVGIDQYVVPFARIDLPYVEVNPADGVRRVFEHAGCPVLSDNVWLRQVNQPGAAGQRPVRASWCHGRRFNAGWGDGSVHCLDDDGTLEANSTSDDRPLPADGQDYASYALRAWRFFEDRR